MNRRSILSSLSSMFLAALAWPRRAEAGSPSAKVPFKTFTTKVYNGSYVQNTLVPGQAPVNVSAYNQQAVSLLGGSTKTFSSDQNQDLIQTLVRAFTTPQSANTSSYTFFAQGVGEGYPMQQTIYVLVSVGYTGKPTITQAPVGVTF